MKFVKNISSGIVITLIRIYQTVLSPLLPRSCRYEPSCSEYTAQAIKKYGAVKGSFMGAQRIGRCHPWSNHDYYDPVV